MAMVHRAWLQTRTHGIFPPRLLKSAKAWRGIGQKYRTCSLRKAICLIFYGQLSKNQSQKLAPKMIRIQFHGVSVQFVLQLYLVS